MKKRFFWLGCVVFAFGICVVSCDKSNSSTPLPSMMNYVLNQNWRIDTVITMDGTANDTLTMADVPGFATSNIRFYNRLDSSFVFRDILNSSVQGPDNRSDVFRYTYGKWSMNPTEDSIHLYSEDTVNARGYKALWAVGKVDSASVLYANYTDTITQGTNPPIYSRKKVVFVKSTFY